MSNFDFLILLVCATSVVIGWLMAGWFGAIGEDDEKDA